LLVSDTLSHNCLVDAPSEEDEVGMKGGELRKMEYFTVEWLKKERQLLEKLKLETNKILGENPLWM